jgi:hypothetical protein
VREDPPDKTKDQTIRTDDHEIGFDPSELKSGCQEEIVSGTDAANWKTRTRLIIFFFPSPETGYLPSAPPSLTI